ncbi:hypothetical protein pb186bvf_015894 [Paramecium bursaria]
MLLFFFLVFINSWRINFNDNGPIDKKNCDDSNKIAGQIKYLSIIQFFKTQYDSDFEYYKLFYSQRLKLNRNLHHPLKKFNKWTYQKQSDLSSLKIKVNENPQDSSVELAYEQLWQIQTFSDRCQWVYKFMMDQIELINLDGYKDDKVKRVLQLYDLKLIEQKIKSLKRDYQICSEHDFEVDLIQQNSKNQGQEQIISASASLSQIQISCKMSNSEIYDLQDFKKQIKPEDCPQNIPRLESFLLEFYKLKALLSFKLYYGKDNRIKDILDDYQQIIINSVPIKEAILKFQIDEQIPIKYDKIQNLLDDVRGIFQDEMIFSGLNKDVATNINELFKNRIQIYNQIKNYKMVLDNTLEFFNLDFQHLQQDFGSLIIFIKDFNYKEDYLWQGIRYFQRDLDICGKKFEIYEERQRDMPKKIFYSKDKIQDQGEKSGDRKELLGDKKEQTGDGKEQSGERKEQMIKITDQAEQCQQKLQIIEQMFTCFDQQNQIDHFRYNASFYDTLFEYIIKDKTIKELKKYQQIFKISEQLYFVQIYPTHDNPNDIQSVEVYDKLLKLQNLIVFLQNAFSKADDLLRYDFSSLQTYKSNFVNFKDGQGKKIPKQSVGINKKYDDTIKDFDQCNNKKYTKYQLESRRSIKENFDINKSRYFYEVDKRNYFFVTKFIQRNPQNLLILPNVVEQFEIEDISNYENSSQQCKADIEGIVEDILETLKILELLKYKQFGQTQFDQKISEVLKFKKAFLQQAKTLYSKNYLFRFTNLYYYPNLEEDCIHSEWIREEYKSFHNFHDNLGYFLYSYYNSIDLLKFNQEDFNQMEENQKWLNDYLGDFSKYQLTDMQNELQELYHQYKLCTGYEFIYDFCEFYEEQNIYGGLCQENCQYEPKKLNILQTAFTEAKTKNKIQKEKQKQKQQMIIIFISITKYILINLIHLMFMFVQFGQIRVKFRVQTKFIKIQYNQSLIQIIHQIEKFNFSDTLNDYMLTITMNKLTQLLRHVNLKLIHFINLILFLKEHKNCIQALYYKTYNNSSNEKLKKIVFNQKLSVQLPSLLINAIFYYKIYIRKLLILRVQYEVFIQILKKTIVCIKNSEYEYELQLVIIRNALYFQIFFISNLLYDIQIFCSYINFILNYFLVRLLVKIILIQKKRFDSNNQYLIFNSIILIIGGRIKNNQLKKNISQQNVGDKIKLSKEQDQYEIIFVQRKLNEDRTHSDYLLQIQFIALGGTLNSFEFSNIKINDVFKFGNGPDWMSLSIELTYQEFVTIKLSSIQIQRVVCKFRIGQFNIAEILCQLKCSNCQKIINRNGRCYFWNCVYDVFGFQVEQTEELSLFNQIALKEEATYFKGDDNKNKSECKRCVPSLIN